MGHVALMWEGSGVCRILVGKPEGKRPLGNTGVDGRIILKWIFGKWDGDMGWLIWLRIGTGSQLLWMG